MNNKFQLTLNKKLQKFKRLVINVGKIFKQRLLINFGHIYLFIYQKVFGRSDNIQKQKDNRNRNLHYSV